MILAKILVLVAASFIILFHSLKYLYQPVVRGTIYLENAPGVATITNEDETGIAHIRGDSLYATMYA